MLIGKKNDFQFSFKIWKILKIFKLISCRNSITQLTNNIIYNMFILCLSTSDQKYDGIFVNSIISVQYLNIKMFKIIMLRGLRSVCNDFKIMIVNIFDIRVTHVADVDACRKSYNVFRQIHTIRYEHSRFQYFYC